MKLKAGAYRRLTGVLVLSLFVVAFLASFASAGGTIETKVKSAVSKVVCDIYRAFIAIVTGIAVVVFVIAGVKWTASENDAGARKAAKDAMVHAIVGLIIVIISWSVINGILSSFMLCPSPGL